MNTLVTISGPSGSGKSALLEGMTKWMTERGVGFNHIPSFTSREPREGEIEGQPYIFVSNEYMCNDIAPEDLIEGDNYNGHYYGTFTKNIDEAPGICGKLITLPGLEQLLDIIPRRRVITVRILLDRSELVERLRGRGESDEFIAERLAGVPENGTKWGVNFSHRWDVSFYNHEGLIDAFAAGLGEVVLKYSESIEGEWDSQQYIEEYRSSMYYNDGGTRHDNPSDVDDECCGVRITREEEAEQLRPFTGLSLKLRQR